MIYLALFPEEVMEEVLIRLPTKSLLRFKCVCKRWYALISSDRLVRRLFDRAGVVMEPQCHLIHNPSEDRSPILNASMLSGCAKQVVKLQDVPGLHLGKKDLIGIHGCFITPQNYRLQDHVAEGADKELFKSTVMGPVNGVYCTMIVGDFSGCTILLWNPLTKKFHVPPPIPPPVVPCAFEEFLPEFSTERQFVACGFGCDTLSNDLKVLAITMHWSLNSRHQRLSYFHLYSHASNTWKQLDPFEVFACHPSCVKVRTDGVFTNETSLFGGRYQFCLNDTCHWLFNFELSDPKPWSILSFNFGDEKFQETMVPNEVSNGRNGRLATVGGHLALVCGSSLGFDLGGYNFDVFVMRRNHGVEELWTRAYSLKLDVSGRFLGIIDDEFLIHDCRRRVVSYRLNAPEIKEMHYEYPPVYHSVNFRLLPYRGSLFQLDVKNRQQIGG